MDIKGRILQSLRPRRNGLLLRSDIGSFGSPSQVSAALHSLVESGSIARLDRGIYAKPATLAQLGKEALLANASLRVKNARNQLIYRTKRTKRTRRAKRSHLMTTAQYVRNLALEGFSFNPIYADRWANAVTNLAGDDVQSDSTDDLLVALTRSGKITPKVMVELVIKHHRDLKRV